MQAEFLENFKQKYPQHDLKMFSDDTSFSMGDININVMTHTMRQHMAYVVEHQQKKFMHLADTNISRVWSDRRLDPIWFKFKNLSIDYLCLTVGAISSRLILKDGTRRITENGFLNPVEAANLVAHINPKHVSVMGIFNFSIWKNRIEYGYSYGEIENYFNWAVNHLSPEMGVHIIRPGNQYKITTDDFTMSVFRPKPKTEIEETPEAT